MTGQRLSVGWLKICDCLMLYKIEASKAWWRQVTLGIISCCYISFSLSSFYRLSQHSDSAPDVTSFLADYSSTCYTSHIYTYFWFQVFFSNVPDFYMCSRSPFHMFSLFFPCALMLFTTFSELLWHFIFLCFIFITLPIHPDAVYKPMHLSSSSSVCKLTLILLLSYSLSKFSLSSQSSLYSLIALLVLW